MPLSGVTVCSISGTTDNHYSLFWKYSWKSRMSLQAIGSIVSSVKYLVIWVTKLTYAYRRGDNTGCCFFLCILTSLKASNNFLNSFAVAFCSCTENGEWNEVGVLVYSDQSIENEMLFDLNLFTSCLFSQKQKRERQILPSVMKIRTKLLFLELRLE